MPSAPPLWRDNELGLKAQPTDRYAPSVVGWAFMPSAPPRWRHTEAGPEGLA